MHLRAEIAIEMRKKAKCLIVSYLLVCSWIETMPG